ncbi:hypothetical protein KSP40_PGU003589 [Platanthera guangdongensis]|uniref:Uncharacterized protein n=1 Tax=Platanthera guangdongensis TaxID=2320717 RepID=A0ABR2MUT0_9ASPA
MPQPPRLLSDQHLATIDLHLPPASRHNHDATASLQGKPQIFYRQYIVPLANVRETPILQRARVFERPARVFFDSRVASLFSSADEVAVHLCFGLLPDRARPYQRGAMNSPGCLLVARAPPQVRLLKDDLSAAMCHFGGKKSRRTSGQNQNSECWLWLAYHPTGRPLLSVDHHSGGMLSFSFLGLLGSGWPGLAMFVDHSTDYETVEDSELGLGRLRSWPSPACNAVIPRVDDPPSFELKYDGF